MLVKTLTDSWNIPMDLQRVEDHPLSFYWFYFRSQHVIKLGVKSVETMKIDSGGFTGTSARSQKLGGGTSNNNKVLCMRVLRYILSHIVRFYSVRLCEILQCASAIKVRWSNLFGGVRIWGCNWKLYSINLKSDLTNGCCSWGVSIRLHNRVCIYRLKLQMKVDFLVLNEYQIFSI